MLSILAEIMCFFRWTCPITPKIFLLDFHASLCSALERRGMLYDASTKLGSLRRYKLPHEKGDLKKPHFGMKRCFKYAFMCAVDIF